MTTVVASVPRETDLPDLVPARMLNEFAYCPRLAYLEWVQGEFTDNLETLEGRFGHRRVDHADRRELPEPHENGADVRLSSEEGAPRPPDVEKLHSRSLMLSAPGEGLIAKIDVLELADGLASPVDYKHGYVPDSPDGAWEPERVQLCAQGLILRENGFRCVSGILYYIDSRRRVTINFDDELIGRTRELLRQLRAVAAAGRIPPPLDDSPKCPRCSLVGICLPDETRLLACPTSLPTRGEVRRLMPARDDALPLYIQDQGTTLGKSGDQLIISAKGQTLRKVKMIDVSQVNLLGNVQVTAQAVRELAAAGIPICHFSYGGWFYAVTHSLIHKNIELRQRQFAVAALPDQSLRLARQFVLGKIKNCRTLLRRHLPENLAREYLAPLARLFQQARRAGSLESLLGVEGLAAKAYFSGFARLLKGPADFQIENRNRRPPRDPVNALLSFVYAMLVKELTLVLHAVGFDPLLGFYHRPRYGRPSLALDLAEPFRPLLADSAVLTLINNGEVAPKDFLRRAGAVALTPPARRTVIGAFERRLDTLVTHPIFGYRISYRQVLEVQARLLARTLLDELPEYPNFCTR